MAEERLQKYLAEAGVASRRASEELIRAGRVAVNGETVREAGVKVMPGLDRVTVDGREVRRAERMRYMMLYKPAGYVSTVRDPQGRPTVMDLLADVPERVFPVGRLDRETEGLLLFTNDGAFAYRMMHPKFEMRKTYEVLLQGQVTEEQLRRLREGVDLEDGRTAPAQVRVLRREKHRTLLELTIHEGRNRQVRRMCRAIRHPVLQLKRVREGILDLKGVGVGEYRDLTPWELQQMGEQLGLDLPRAGGD